MDHFGSFERGACARTGWAVMMVKMRDMIFPLFEVHELGRYLGWIDLTL